jgi:phosphoglycerate-specific signal transduction histidine kinase
VAVRWGKRRLMEPYFIYKVFVTPMTQNVSHVATFYTDKKEADSVCNDLNKTNPSEHTTYVLVKNIEEVADIIKEMM